MGERFHVGLRRAEEQEPDHPGHEEPMASVAEELAARARTQRKPAGRPGQQKEQGDTPLAEERDEDHRDQALFLVLDEPVL